MQEPTVTLELAKEFGLTQEEFEEIQKILGRIPNYTELGIFSVMWSEHCSYKNSITLLKTLPRDGENLLVSAGEENAGIIDIGDNLAVVFKIESHNHPSAVEPYQGAATGVGGILRDIFTMGARPIAALNSLRFGSLKNERTKFLLEGVVKGIGDYGNSFGVPTVGGEVFFDESYQDNPLVNAMAVGIVKHDRIASAVSKGRGNSVMIVGALTGRDGIHGATFASDELSEKNESKRPSVQVGDPFTEKLLLEATLELVKYDWLIGIQDMGAAGISCSTSEMSEKGNSGMKIDLDNVPLREEGMSAYEIMLSESQERMLCTVKKGFESDVKKIFKKWDLACQVIGEVTEDGMISINYKGEEKVNIPAYDLVLGGGAPVYIRETKEPKYLDETRNYDFSKLPKSESLTEDFKKVFSSPNISSKKWIYEQYDYMVRTNTIIGPGCDSAVVRLKGTNKALAITTDCNGRYVYLNPRIGTQIAVAEAARNIVCTGGKPLGVTNCLNFGNPYKPEIFWQFKEAVKGMELACKEFKTPVTGGNVSFYNESPNTAVYPTPTIGMVGIIENTDDIVTSYFKSKSDLIYLLGSDREEIGGSEYLKVVHNLVTGDVPLINFTDEKKLQHIISNFIKLKFLKSAHDISEGGIICALAECCVINEEKLIGANVKIPIIKREDFSLFSETQSRIIVSIDENNKNQFEKTLNEYAQPYNLLGITGGNNFIVNDVVKLSTNELHKLYYNTIHQFMNG